jgi:hypothetical protein
VSLLAKSMQLHPKVYLTIKGSEAKRVIHVGDTVFIVTPPRGVALEDIALFPAPFVVRLEQTAAKKRWQVRVQYQTVNKQTHVHLFYPRQLRASKPVLSIGDRVVVKEAMPPVVVPVGTEGTVVGGDGCCYHITFLMHQFQPPVMVSQDHVPADAIVLASEAADLVAPQPELQDEGGESESAVEVEVVDEVEEAGAETPPSFLLRVCPRLYATLALQLQPSVLAAFDTYCQERGVTESDAGVSVQGHLTHFLRGHPGLPHLSPEQKAALVQAGASPAQMARLSKDGVTPHLTVEACVARLARLS